MIRLGHLDDMHVPGWLVSPFDMKIINKGHESVLEDKLIGTRVYLVPNTIKYQYCY